MRRFWKNLSPKLLVFFASALTKLLRITLRKRIYGLENLSQNGTGKLLAIWHGRSLTGCLTYVGKNWYVLVSNSRDGDITTNLLEKFGLKSVRGSTSKGGAKAAAEIVSLLKEGATIIVTPDGPRGPTNKVQEGIVWLAKTSAAQIIPVAVTAKPRKFAKSWDKHLIPFPFSKTVVHFDDPMVINENASELELQNDSLQLEEKMNQLQKQLDENLKIK